MLTREENDLLTRVSNGAPMGQMIRQNWWIPAALSDKLEADGKPLRVQLFGEQYVAFRATSGKVGFFDEAARTGARRSRWGATKTTRCAAFSTDGSSTSTV